MPRRVAAVLAVVLVAVAAGSPAHARTDTLPDGFWVADGTRLVGPVFPNIGDVTGWTAVFDVDTDAVTVCTGCGDSGLVASTGIIELRQDDRGSGMYVPGQRTITAATGPTVELSTADRERLRTAMRAADRTDGDGSATEWSPTIGWVVNPRLHGARGARLASPSTSFGDRCQPDETTVLRVTGDTDKSLDELVDRVDGVSEGSWATERARRDGRDVTEISDDFWSFTAVGPKSRGASYILANLCGD